MTTWRRIITVGLNPAIDRVIEVERFALGFGPRVVSRLLLIPADLRQFLRRGFKRPSRVPCALRFKEGAAAGGEAFVLDFCNLNGGLMAY